MLSIIGCSESEDLESEFDRAYNLFKDGNCEESLKKFDELIEKSASLKFEQKEVFLSSRADVLYECGHYQKAIKELLFLARKGNLEFRGDYYNSLGNCYYALDNLNEAIINYELAIQNDEDNSVFYYNLGMLYAELDSCEAALPNLEHSEYLEPGDSALRAEMGYCLIEKGDHQEARKVLMPLIEEDSSAQILNFIGLSYAHEEKIDTALMYYSAAINQEDSVTLLHFNRGMAYLAMEDWKNSKSDFELVVSLDSTFADAYTQLAYLRYQADANNEAIALAKKGIALGDETYEAYYWLGTYFTEVKDMDKACEAFRKIEDPNDELKAEMKKLRCD